MCPNSSDSSLRSGFELQASNSPSLLSSKIFCPSHLSRKLRKSEECDSAHQQDNKSCPHSTESKSSSDCPFRSVLGYLITILIILLIISSIHPLLHSSTDKDRLHFLNLDPLLVINRPFETSHLGVREKVGEERGNINST